MKQLPVSPGWRWFAIQLLFLAALCAVGGPGMAGGDERRAAGVLAAVCFLGPIRAVSAVLEWYLVREVRQRTILISHAIGLGSGAMLGTGPPSNATSTGIHPISGWALGVFSYVLITLVGLMIGSAIAFLRRKRHGSVVAAHVRGQSLAALPALFWFNAVFIVAVALIISPSMAGQNKSSLTYGFFGGLLVGLLLRLPGTWAEWWLTKHVHHRSVYVAHIAAGLLSAFVVAINVVSPGPGVSTAVADMLGTAIGTYLLSDSLMLACEVVVFSVSRSVRRRRSGRHTAPQSSNQQWATQGIPAQARLEQQEPVTRADISEPSVSAEVARQQPAIIYRTVAPVPKPAETEALAEMATADAGERPRSPDDSAQTSSRTEKLRNEIGLALGIVVGLASLVQGYDSTDPFRTVVVALAIGFIGFGLIYASTTRR